MWSLETLKLNNLKNYERIPIAFLTQEKDHLDLEQHSYKTLTEPFKYKGQVFYYLAPNTIKGVDFIENMINDIGEARYINEIDVYIF